MMGPEAVLTAVGFSHPPEIKPVQKRRRDGSLGQVTWHKADCPAPEGRCPLKTGCASPPAGQPS